MGDPFYGRCTLLRGLDRNALCCTNDSCSSGRGGTVATGRLGRTEDPLYGRRTLLRGRDRNARFVPTIAVRRAGGVLQRRVPGSSLMKRGDCSNQS